MSGTQRRTLVSQLCFPFSLLFQRSFDEGVVPESWKAAKVIPIFKKGDRSDPGNYRPISLTSVVCKVFESIIREGIINHMLSNNLLSNTQHGFLLKRSCMSQLLTAMEFWTNEIQKGNPVDVIYERLLIKYPMRDFLLS